MPALLVTVPGAVVLAASEEAARLLGVAADQLVGRDANDFAADDNPRLLELVQSGRLSAFEATRLLRRAGAAPEPLQVWVRAAKEAPADSAVVVLWPRGRAGLTYLPVTAAETAVVVGTVDERLQVERVSDDVAALGLDADDVVGSSFLRLVAVSSAADVLHTLADATTTERGISVPVRIASRAGEEIGDLLVRPVEPAPSFVFALVRGPGLGDGRDERGLAAMALGLHGLSVAEVVGTTATSGTAGALVATVPGQERLTPREHDVVARVVDGDRVPYIAAAMYVTQSTVRNHLSNAFRKLRVGNQQELIELFRNSAIRLPTQVKPPMA